MAQGSTKGVPIDTDNTLSLNSDLVVPSQKAIKSYVDNNFQIRNIRRHSYTAGSPAYDYLGYSPTGVVTNYDWTVTTMTIQKDGTATKTTAINQQWTH
jgi:hypothetical protein